MKRPPKNFTKLASAPDFERLKESIKRYFGGEEKEFRKNDTGYSIHRKDGRALNTIVLETSRGFYFGYFA